jgi:hypothetical protein
MSTSENKQMEIMRRQSDYEPVATHAQPLAHWAHFVHGRCASPNDWKRFSRHGIVVTDLPYRVYAEGKE